MKAVSNASEVVIRSFVQSVIWASEFLMMPRQMRWTFTWVPASRGGRGHAVLQTYLRLSCLLPSLHSPSLVSLPFDCLSGVWDVWCSARHGCYTPILALPDLV